MTDQQKIEEMRRALELILARVDSGDMCTLAYIRGVCKQALGK